MGVSGHAVAPGVAAADGGESREMVVHTDTWTEERRFIYVMACVLMEVSFSFLIIAYFFNCCCDLFFLGVGIGLASLFVREDRWRAKRSPEGTSSMRSSTWLPL